MKETKIRAEKDYILSNTAGVAQMALSMKKIRDFEYHIPPIEYQNKFAVFVQQIDKSKYFGGVGYGIC